MPLGFSQIIATGQRTGHDSQKPLFTKETSSKLPHEANAKSGDDRARTDNPRLAKAVLSQLSYIPV